MKKMKKEDAQQLLQKLRGSVGKVVRVSLTALKEQWFDMLRLLGFVEKKDGEAEDQQEETHTLYMRLSMKGWTDPDAVCLSTRRKSFTIGNAPQFDVFLDPSVASVGELYCAVFFDKGINSYVFMLVSGGFSVPVKETDEPYLPGDWSLFTSGNREQTDLHNAIRVPVSSPDQIEHVRFNIANTFYFEAWACETDSCMESFAVPQTVAPAEEPMPDAQVVIPPVMPAEDIFEQEPSVVQAEAEPTVQVPATVYEEPAVVEQEPPVVQAEHIPFTQVSTTVYEEPATVIEVAHVAQTEPLAVQEEPPAVPSDPVAVQEEPPAVSWIDAVSSFDAPSDVPHPPPPSPSPSPSPSPKKKVDPMSEEALRMAINAVLGQQHNNHNSSDNTQGDDSGCN
ncbi:MAG: hypothetical protein IJC45_05040 [Clostridia bacterium]|nr:hypothetical protein [Clostridia bacterium]